MSTASAKPSYWIRGPLYDLMFFCTAWCIPVFLILYRHLEAAVGVAIFWTGYHVLLRYPHFVATARVTYLKPENREYYRENWVRYFLVPALIITVYTARSAFGPEGTGLNRLLSTIVMTWGFQHISFQNYGILSVYRGRAKTAADTFSRKFERIIFLGLFVLYAVQQGIPMWIHDARIDQAVSVFSVGLKVLLAFAVLLYLVRMILVRKTYAFSFPAFLFFLSAVVSMVYWPFYDSYAGPVNGPTLFFYIYNAHHCIAYLGLLFHIDCNYKQKSGSVFGASFMKYAVFLVMPIAFSLVLVALTSNHLSNALAGYMNSNQFTMQGFLQGFFLVHYYIESNSWKLSRPHYRKNIVPLLRQPVVAVTG